MNFDVIKFFIYIFAGLLVLSIIFLFRGFKLLKYNFKDIAANVKGNLFVVSLYTLIGVVLLIAFITANTIIQNNQRQLERSFLGQEGFISLYTNQKLNQEDVLELNAILGRTYEEISPLIYEKLKVDYEEDTFYVVSTDFMSEDKIILNTDEVSVAEVFSEHHGVNIGDTLVLKRKQEAYEVKVVGLHKNALNFSQYGNEYISEGNIVVNKTLFNYEEDQYNSVLLKNSIVNIDHQSVKDVIYSNEKKLYFTNLSQIKAQNSVRPFNFILAIILPILIILILTLFIFLRNKQSANIAQKNEILAYYHKKSPFIFLSYLYNKQFILLLLSGFISLIGGLILSFLMYKIFEEDLNKFIFGLDSAFNVELIIGSETLISFVVVYLILGLLVNLIVSLGSYKVKVESKFLNFSNSDSNQVKLNQNVVIVIILIGFIIFGLVYMYILDSFANIERELFLLLAAYIALFLSSYLISLKIGLFKSSILLSTLLILINLMSYFFISLEDEVYNLILDVLLLYISVSLGIYLIYLLIPSLVKFIKLKRVSLYLKVVRIESIKFLIICLLFIPFILIQLTVLQVNNVELSRNYTPLDHFDYYLSTSYFDSSNEEYFESKDFEDLWRVYTSMAYLFLKNDIKEEEQAIGYRSIFSMPGELTKRLDIDQSALENFSNSEKYVFLGEDYSNVDSFEVGDTISLNISGDKQIKREIVGFLDLDGLKDYIKNNNFLATVVEQGVLLSEKDFFNFFQDYFLNSVYMMRLSSENTGFENELKERVVIDDGNVENILVKESREEYILQLTYTIKQFLLIFFILFQIIFYGYITLYLIRRGEERRYIIDSLKNLSWKENQICNIWRVEYLWVVSNLTLLVVLSSTLMSFIIGNYEFDVIDNIYQYNRKNYILLLSINLIFFILGYIVYNFKLKRYVKNK